MAASSERKASRRLLAVELNKGVVKVAVKICKKISQKYHHTCYHHSKFMLLLQHDGKRTTQVNEISKRLTINKFHEKKARRVGQHFWSAVNIGHLLNKKVPNEIGVSGASMR